MCLFSSDRLPGSIRGDQHQWQGYCLALTHFYRVLWTRAPLWTHQVWSYFPQWHLVDGKKSSTTCTWLLRYRSLRARSFSAAPKKTPVEPRPVCSIILLNIWRLRPESIRISVKLGQSWNGTARVGGWRMNRSDQDWVTNGRMD